ncbi:MAG: hypothetical protein F6K15_22400 [Okeania sp. SIO2B3]|nr:hypothetical protein [Okeania sp. SIO2B3]
MSLELLHYLLEEGRRQKAEGRRQKGKLYGDSLRQATPRLLTPNNFKHDR